MKNRIKQIKNVAFNLVLIFLLSSLVSCEKNSDIVGTNDGKPIPIAISLIGLKLDQGYCYKLGYNLPVNGDSAEAPTASTLVLFENGVELPVAHANHQSIRDYGGGQYSHWGNSLYFSASDNTNPLDNGRKYTYILKK